MSLCGGIAGVIGSQFTIAGVAPAIAAYSIFLAFGTAVLLIGLFFSTYPAHHATGMRPIGAALRVTTYEKKSQSLGWCHRLVPIIPGVFEDKPGAPGASRWLKPVNDP